MSLDTVRARWVEAGGLNPPEARCGHSAVAVDSRQCWGEEFLVRRRRREEVRIGFEPFSPV